MAAKPTRLRINTRRGLLALGDPPPTRIACAFCGGPAQIATGRIAACAGCTVHALETAAHLADTPGAPSTADPGDTRTMSNDTSSHIGVLFHDVGEFLQELAIDTQAEAIERRIVRVTEMFTPAMNGTFQRVHVVAGYIERECGRPVQVEHYVGDDWGEGFNEREQLVDRAVQLKDRIQRACEGHGLQVRGGALRPVRPARGRP
jgi:hypothetical protein